MRKYLLLAGWLAGGVVAVAHANMLQFSGVPPGPVNNTPPNITPTTGIAVSTVLTCNGGTWTPSTGYTSTYQFFRDTSTSIQGPASGNTYTVATADQGHSITCKQIATTTGSTTSPASNSVPVPAGPITLLSHTSCVASGASCTTPAISTTGATLIVIDLTSASGTPAAPTDSTGNTYTMAAGFITTNANPSDALYIKYGPATGGSVTFTCSNFGANCSVEVFNNTIGSAVDQSTTSSSGAATSLATGTITPTASGEVVVAGLSLSCATTTTGLAMTTLTATDLINGTASTYGGGAGYIVQTSPAAVSSTFSWATSTCNSGSTIASFK